MIWNVKLAGMGRSHAGVCAAPSRSIATDFANIAGPDPGIEVENQSAFLHVGTWWMSASLGQ